MTDSYYITTPIYYANDVPHIGHAYTTLACDFIARFHRLDGKDVFFLTGTDEHGQKVQKSAEKAGLSPQDYCDKIAARFEELCEALNISHDRFIRTTEDRHKAAAQELWRRIEANGYIYPGSYSGWYSVRDEAFYQEGELTTAEEGIKLAPTGAPVEWVEEESYFFKLSAFEDRLLELYGSDGDFVLPRTRLNEVKSFVEGGLKDLSISRTTFDWGVPVPGRDGHVMYVWIDALTNYLTGVGFPDKDYEDWWPANLHMVGKDILRFHAVYWPAFLMAAGIETPKRVFAHGWWTNEGQKISKSLGNVIDPFSLVEEFGLDPVRYFLMREVPFGNDGDFSRQAFVKRCNADLANGLGNLAQRTLSMIAKNCYGKVPELISRPKPIDYGQIAHFDTAGNSPNSRLDELREQIERLEPDYYLRRLWTDISEIDRYLAQQKPWVLKKSDPDRMGTVLFTAAEAIRNIAILAQPVMPESANRILDQLSVPSDQRLFAHLGPKFELQPGTALPPPEGVFPRIQLKEEV